MLNLMGSQDNLVWRSEEVPGLALLQQSQRQGQTGLLRAVPPRDWKPSGWSQHSLPGQPAPLPPLAPGKSLFLRSCLNLSCLVQPMPLVSLAHSS